MAATDSSHTVVVLPLVAMGRLDAAISVNEGIVRWRPSVILLCGISGGFGKKGVARGDIVVANQIVDYEHQKLREEQTEYRWRSHQVDRMLLSAAQNLRPDEWKGDITSERPGDGSSTVHFGPIASGDKVVARERFIAELHKRWSDALGVEMEGAGAVVAAASAQERPRFLMIRSISDLADSNKDDSWREYACAAAAAFTVSLIRSGLIAPRHDLGPSATSAARQANRSELESEIAEQKSVVLRLERELEELMRRGRATGSGIGAALQQRYQQAYDRLAQLREKAGRPTSEMPPRLEWPVERK